MAEMNVDDTLERIRQMEPYALGEMHDRFYPEIYRYVYFRIGDSYASEAITTQVFLHLIDALRHRGGPRRNLRGWLFRIAAHLVTEFQRQRIKSHEAAQDITVESRRRAGDPSTFDDEADSLMDLALLQRALGRLAPEQQHLLALRFAQDRSLEVIAQILEQPVARLKVLHYHALQMLSNYWRTEMAQ